MKNRSFVRKHTVLRSVQITKKVFCFVRATQFHCITKKYRIFLLDLYRQTKRNKILLLEQNETLSWYLNKIE